MINFKKLFFFLFIPFYLFGFDNTKVEIIPTKNLNFEKQNSKFGFDGKVYEDIDIKPFFIHRYEVSMGEFYSFAKSYIQGKKTIENLDPQQWLEKYWYDSDYDEDDYNPADFPVSKVSYDMANKYCKSIDGRLLSELEWMVASVTPTKIGRYQEKLKGFVKYVSIDYPIDDGHFLLKSSQDILLRCNDNRYNDKYCIENSMSLPVYMTVESANGLFGMMGNVWEITSSTYGVNHKDNQKIILKGGSYRDSLDMDFLDIRFRNYISKKSTSHEYDHIGFRCVFDK